MTDQKKRTDPLKAQVGGSHYRNMRIQPIEFIHANKLGFIEGCCIKYLCRHKSKGGAEDLRKAIHYLELLIQQQYGEER